MRPHEASHMLSSTPLVYSLRAPHPISSRTGSVGGALLRLLARLGDPSRASSPLSPQEQLSGPLMVGVSPCGVAHAHL